MATIKSKIEDEPADSFTSMIDVVFLLLIFFILQPFKSPEKRLRSELPKDEGPSNASPQMKESVRVQIYVLEGAEAEALFKIGKKKIRSLDMDDDSDELAHAIIAASGNNPDTPVILAPWTKVHFKHVLRALDQCYVAGMHEIKWEAPGTEKTKPLPVK